MVRPLKKHKLEQGLRRKGFQSVASKSGKRVKHIYFELLVDGKRTGISTSVSHSDDEIRGKLQSIIAKELRMPSISYLGEYVDCTKSFDQYLMHLRTNDLIPP